MVEEGLNKTGGVESNAVVVDQVMEEVMGQPHLNRGSNLPPDQVVEESLNETGSVDAKTVRFCEEDGRMHSADKGLEACQCLDHYQIVARLQWKAVAAA